MYYKLYYRDMWSCVVLGMEIKNINITLYEMEKKHNQCAYLYVQNNIKQQQPVWENPLMHLISNVSFT